MPSKNDTPATPTLSAADAVIVTTPDTVPAAGAVMLTVGATVSPPTVTFTRPTVVSPIPSMISYVKTSEPVNPARAVYVYGSAPAMAPPFALVAPTRFTRSELPVSFARSDAPVNAIGLTDVVVPMLSVPAIGHVSVAAGGAVQNGPVKGLVCACGANDVASKSRKIVAAATAS